VALKIEKTDSEPYETRTRLAPLPPREASLESQYILLLLDSWKLIAAVTAVAVIGTYLLTKFVLTRWYQATAIIEPVPEGAVENRVEGGMGAIAGGGISSLLMATGIDSQAQEYLTILRSFTFNTGVAVRHNLTGELLRDISEKPNTERKLKMKVFDILKARFKVDYSIQAHNLSVHFLDRDPIRAQEILQFYLDDLRDLQRQDAIKNATAAIDSLEKEASSTGDSLLRENLYALVARQVQREKLAEVEADFAFRVLEVPVSPDRPYSPRASINCFLAMLLTPMIMSGVIVIRHSRRAGEKIDNLNPWRRPAAEHGTSF
jgi:LPS O-antigen subunit length determinant protein (WzzB/FepE family)